MNATTKNINIKVSAQGVAGELKAIANQMGALHQSAKKTASTAGTLSFAFNGFLALQVGRFVKNAADDFQLLQDRLKTFALAGDDAKETFLALVEAAEFSKTSIKDLGVVYSR